MMSTSDLLLRHSQRLLQIGIALFLFTSFWGFAVEYMKVPHLGLSVHTLAAFSGVFMLAIGLLWPRLILGRKPVSIAFWFTIYSDLATLAAYVLAALWGAGNSVIPLAAGSAHGSGIQEILIMVVLYSAAPTGITAFALILFGLRTATYRVQA